MKFGIEENEKGIFCARCNMLLSKDGFIPSEYCPKCGNPLTIESIETVEKNEIKHDKLLLKELNEISKKIKSDSFKKIVKTYLQID